MKPGDKKPTLFIRIRLRRSHGRPGGSLSRRGHRRRLRGCTLDADADIVVQPEAAAVCFDGWVSGVTNYRGKK